MTLARPPPVPTLAPTTQNRGVVCGTSDWANHGVPPWKLEDMLFFIRKCKEKRCVLWVHIVRCWTAHSYVNPLSGEGGQTSRPKSFSFLYRTIQILSFFIQPGWVHITQPIINFGANPNTPSQNPDSEDELISVPMLVGGVY